MSEGFKMPAGFRIFLCCLPLLVFTGLLAVSLQGRPVMTAIYAATSFYIILVLVLLWAFHLARYLKGRGFSPTGFLRTHWAGLLLSLAVTAAIFFSVPVYLKVLNDETNLLAVSQSMFHYQDANRISMATFFQESIRAIAFEVPIRPLLFPFFTWLLHLILGYHHQNAFILNFLVMFVFLAGVYACARRFTRPAAAGAALFLVAAYPVFSIYGTTGGYDLFSSLFFFLSLVLLYRYLAAPAPEGFALLWVTLLMLANIRNESIVFLPLVIVVVFFFTRKLFFKECLHVYLLTPLLLLPYAWQRILSVGEYENPEDVSLFGLRHLADNFGVLLRNFLNLDFYLPYAGILNLAAVVIILYLAGQLAMRRISLTPARKAFWVIFALCLCVHTGITLSHFMGLYDGPTQARFFLNLSICCALSPVLLAAVYPDRFPARALLAGAVGVFLLYHPIAVRHDFIGSTFTSRTHREETRFLKNLNDPKVLVLSPYCTQFSALNYSALNMHYANRHRNELRREFDGGRYSRIIAFQHIDTRTGQLAFRNQALDPAFVLTPLETISVFPNLVLRISEVGFADGGF